MDLPAELPRPPDIVCFSGNEFLGDSFTVETFISQCKSRGASLEQLRDDLDIYFRLLKNTLIDMINSDYSEYIQVSQSMVGLDSHIMQITGHTKLVQEKIITIKKNVGEHLQDIDSKLMQHQDLMDKRKNLQSLVQISELVNNFEFGQSFCDGLLPRLEKASIDIAMLQHLLSRVHPNIARRYEGKVISLRNELTSQLCSAFLESLDGNEKDSIRKCLKLYASLGLQREAEDLFRREIVHGYMSENITPLKLEELGLQQLYQTILDFVSTHCTSLLRLTSERSSGYDPNLLKMGVGFDSQFVYGYSFLVRAVWPSITQLFIQNIPDTFLVTDIPTFHDNYTHTLSFIQQFELLCETKSNLSQLRGHGSYIEFLERWDLTVYYQLSFREIAGLLEQSLDTPFDTHPHLTDSPFKLKVFSTLWSCLSRCWSDSTFLLPLTHRFWKLTLQLLARTSTWSQTLNQIPNITVDTLALLLHDVDIVVDEISNFCNSTIKPMLSLLPNSNGNMLEEAIEWSQRQFSEAAPFPLDSIVSHLTQQCTHPLEQAHSIPRLYRKTNKEQPSRSSGYVTASNQPLRNFKLTYSPLLLPHRITAVLASVIEQTSARYLVVTNEMLTAVKRTEDSLLRIKQRTGSLAHQLSIPSGPDGSPAMSDDNKIRLQLAIDLEEFVRSLGELVPVDSIGPCNALAQCAANARLEIENVC